MKQSAGGGPASAATCATDSSEHSNLQQHWFLRTLTCAVTCLQPCVTQSGQVVDSSHAQAPHLAAVHPVFPAGASRFPSPSIFAINEAKPSERSSIASHNAHQWQATMLINRKPHPGSLTSEALAAAQSRSTAPSWLSCESLQAHARGMHLIADRQRVHLVGRGLDAHARLLHRRQQLRAPRHCAQTEKPWSTTSVRMRSTSLPRWAGPTTATRGASSHQSVARPSQDQADLRPRNALQAASL